MTNAPDLIRARIAALKSDEQNCKDLGSPVAASNARSRWQELDALLYEVEGEDQQNSVAVLETKLAKKDEDIAALYVECVDFKREVERLKAKYAKYPCSDEETDCTAIPWEKLSIQNADLKCEVWRLKEMLCSLENDAGHIPDTIWEPIARIKEERG